MARANSDGEALLAMLKAQQPPTSGVQQLQQAPPPPPPSSHLPSSRGLPPSPVLTASSGADPRAFWDSAVAATGPPIRYAPTSYPPPSPHPPLPPPPSPGQQPYHAFQQQQQQQLRPPPQHLQRPQQQQQQQQWRPRPQPPPGFQPRPPAASSPGADAGAQLLAFALGRGGPPPPPPALHQHGPHQQPYQQDFYQQQQQQQRQSQRLQQPQQQQQHQHQLQHQHLHLQSATPQQSIPLQHVPQFPGSQPGGSYAAVGLRGAPHQKQQPAPALQAQPRVADALSANLTALRLVEPQRAPAAAPNTRVVDQKVGVTAVDLLRGTDANGPEPPRPALQPGPAPHPSTSGDRWRAGKTAQYRKPLKADLDLVSRQLFELCRTLRPSENEQRSLQQFVQHVQQLVYQDWPGVRLHPFGSYANGFTVKNSDVDLCLEVEDEETTKADHVTRLADILERNGMKDVQALTHARVPIVKFKDPQSGVACDICVNNLLAVANTRLLYTYASLDPRLKQLALIVKHWAKRRQVNETYRGTLSSYAYVLMCIYFLQTRQPPVLPCLQAMEATCQGEANGVPYQYFDQVEPLKDFGDRNTETLGTLLVEFYRYWAREHDYNNHVISVRTGGPIRKEDKNWTKRVGVDRHLICIEDPFDTTHDLGRVVDKMSITVLKDEFFRALRAFENMLKPIPFLFEPYRRGQDQ